jgi:hypothetical protein
MPSVRGVLPRAYPLICCEGSVKDQGMRSARKSGSLAGLYKITVYYKMAN